MNNYLKCKTNKYLERKTSIATRQPRNGTVSKANARMLNYIAGKLKPRDSTRPKQERKKEKMELAKRNNW